MEIPFLRWYPVIATRRSRRQFDATFTMTPEIITNLQTVCHNFKPFHDVRVELILQAPDKIFNIIAGSYGIVKNACAAFIFIGDITNRHIAEEVGYTGEGAILEATALGLATCWMAGTFNPKAVTDFVKINHNEKVLAVSPLGFASESVSITDKIMSSFGRHSLRKPLESLVSGLPEKDWQFWVKTALEAARLAPSAINRQPWRFEIKSDSIIISTDKSKTDYRISKRLDCGIAMLHLEVAALNQGVKGYWRFLEEPQVASFNISKSLEVLTEHR